MRQHKTKLGGILNVMEKGETLNPNGRPKKLVSTINDQLKAEGFKKVSPAQVVDAFETILNLPQDRITEIVNDKDAPMLLRIVAKSLLSVKGFEIVEKIIDRVHGKPAQKVESINIDLDKDITKDELDSIKQKFYSRNWELENKKDS